MSDENDPLSPHNAPGISLIVLMRVYDVLMGLYTEANPDQARTLMEIHAAGSLLGPSPVFNGEFMSDIINAEHDEVQSERPE